MLFTDQFSSELKWNQLLSFWPSFIFQIEEWQLRLPEGGNKEYNMNLWSGASMELQLIFGLFILNFIFSKVTKLEANQV